MKKHLLAFALLASLCLASCGGIEGPVSPARPEISLGRDEPLYRAKVGEPVEIAPVVKNAGESPLYRWTIDGEVVGTEASFTFVGVKAGSVYITFEVIADHGQAETEVRVDVAPVKFPTVTLVVPSGGFKLLAGDELPLSPSVNNADGTAFLWEVDSRAVSTEREYTFTETETGGYSLKFTAANADGADSVEFTVTVCTEEQMAFVWEFERTQFNVSLGRTLFIRPYRVVNAFDARYNWSVNGETADPPVVDTKYAGTAPACLFAFKPEREGAHTVAVTMTNSYVSRTQEFTVVCSPPEGTFKRPAGASASPDWNRVYEYLPAAGQFINENSAPASMDEACAYAEERLRGEAYVSLGAFGGSIVLGFGHSIENDGGYNIQLLGNSFKGSSEPGIVWVMQDENGDGQPNDTWYELRGCEYGRGDTRLDYAVTYYRPSSPERPVAWSDNEGGSGEVDYLPAFHRQDYYYPSWVVEDSYTLVGRRLAPRVEMITESYWVNHEYDWGYADNFSPTDRLTDDDNQSAAVNANHFRISDAVTYDGRPANLAYVDFIKVQTGVQAKAGWLGEISTELFGARDYNLIKGGK